MCGSHSEVVRVKCRPDVGVNLGVVHLEARFEVERQPTSSTVQSRHSQHVSRCLNIGYQAK